jgi:hypothetical protein
MKFQDLSAEDQALVRTDFGDMDKVAEGMVKQATECYERGYEKTAAEIADNVDKLAEESKKEEEEEKKEHEEHPEHEKAAAELGAIYERGVFDGLAKLGSDRHGDPMHYFWPFIEEKVAAAGAHGAVSKFLSKVKGHAEGLKPSAIMEHGRRAVQGTGPKGGHLSAGARAAEGGKAVAKSLPYAAALGGAGYGAHHMMKKKD